MPKDPICGMSVKDSDALKLEHNGQSYFFCSKNCLKKFAEEHDIAEVEVSSAMSKGTKRFYKNKTLIVSSIIVLLIILSYFIPVLVQFRKSFLMYLSMVWWAILLGLVLGGLIDYFIPRKYISKILTAQKKRTVFYSVILGFFMSFCSHGILALSIQLHKKGAPNFSIISFLLASPWANMAVTLMLFGFFGLKALYILFSAILIAIVTGLIFLLFETKGIVEKNQNSIEVDRDFSIINDIKNRFKAYKFSSESLIKDCKGVWAGTVSLSNMILWWILIGMAMAGAANAFVPSNFFENYMGPHLMGLVITLVFATIIEVCSEGSAPIAFEIFKQTKALGNSFVFLMAGVATDYTEIGLIWINISKKIAVLLPLVTVPQIILLGYIANIIF